jgi:predicted amidophosphoribosyltransferase
MGSRFYPNLVEGVMSMWLPRRCLHCGAFLPYAGEALGREALKRALCTPCRMLLADSRLMPCDLPLRVGSMRLAACWMFSDASPIRSLHHVFKYEGRADVAPLLAAPLADVVRRLLPTEPASAFVTAPEGPRPIGPPVCSGVPSHRLRVLDRGYCQAHVLAESLAAELDVPVVRGILERRGQTRSQTTLSAVERRDNVARAFHLAADACVPPAVILVDDVVTTGATLIGCANILRASGCRFLLLAAPGVRPPLPLGGHFKPV